MKRTLCFLSIMVASFAVPLWCSPSVKAETECDGPTECVEDPHYYACPDSGDDYYDECRQEGEYYYGTDDYCPCYEPSEVDTAAEEACPVVAETVGRRDGGILRVRFLR